MGNKQSELDRITQGEGVLVEGNISFLAGGGTYPFSGSGILDRLTVTGGKDDRVQLTVGSHTFSAVWADGKWCFSERVYMDRLRHDFFHLSIGSREAVNARYSYRLYPVTPELKQGRSIRGDSLIYQQTVC